MGPITAHLILDDLVADRDAADLHEAFSDADTMRYWQHRPTTQLKETLRLLEYQSRSDTTYWVVRTEPDGPAVGEIGLMTTSATPGLLWILRPDSRGRGIATEAVGAVVDYAFDTLGLPAVEAWVEVGNTASEAVARRVGLTDQGRFVLRYAHRDGPSESVVWGRLRERSRTTVYATEPVLEVSDVDAVIDLLRTVFEFRTAYQVPGPPARAAIRVGPWTTSTGFQVVGTGGKPTPQTVYLHAGFGLDLLYEQAQRHGLAVVEPLESKPWVRREFVVEIPDGHRLVLSGPV